MATRDYSKKQEDTVAKYLDGKTTPNSGATGFAKGDVLVYDTIVECKTKTKPATTHSIKKEWIETLNLTDKVNEINNSNFSDDTKNNLINLLIEDSLDSYENKVTYI